MPDISASRRRYLQALQREKRRIVLCRWGFLLALLLVWEVGARLGWIDDFLLSSPSRMAATVADLYRQGQLFVHIGITLGETLAGFFLGGVLGIGLAVVLWWNTFACKVADIYLVVLNSLPKIALGPILIVWMGIGQAPIIAMAVFVSVVVTLTTVLTGFQEAAPEKILLMRTFGASKWQIFTMVVWPGSRAQILSALKLNIGMSWVGVIVGEFLVSRAGLGYLIVYGGQVFKLDLVMAATAILCVLATLMYFAIALLEKKLRRGR